jgi:hypothetical protein
MVWQRGGCQQQLNLPYIEPITDHINLKKAQTFSKPVMLQRLKNKGKAVPLQAWTGPEGYRKLRLKKYP